MEDEIEIYKKKKKKRKCEQWCKGGGRGLCKVVQGEGRGKWWAGL